MRNINEVLLNPVRMRIIQELAMHAGGLTSTDICNSIEDVPRTTMYRHIQLLLGHQIIKVVAERKVRGSLERTLMLNIETLKGHNTSENLAQNALGFLLQQYAKFDVYARSGDVNPGRDRLFLNNTVLMLTDGEYDEFLSGLQKLLVSYSNRKHEGRRVRDISIISSPEVL